jgi:acyl carrier protein
VDLQDRIRKIIVECLELDLDASEISADASLTQDLGLDSSALLELVTGLEESFGFEVDVDDVTEENFHSVAAIARYVKGRDGPAASA